MASCNRPESMSCNNCSRISAGVCADAVRPKTTIETTIKMARKYGAPGALVASSVIRVRVVVRVAVAIVSFLRDRSQCAVHTRQWREITMNADDFLRMFAYDHWANRECLRAMRAGDDAPSGTVKRIELKSAV